MRVQQPRWSFFIDVNRGLALLAAACLVLLVAAPSAQAITWEATGGTKWWFDPENWSEADAMLVPPMGDEDNDPMTNGDLAVSTTNINFTIPAVSGDYNENNTVDAADYTVWRDSLGLRPLPNTDPDDTDGIVTQDEYTFWKSEFGETSLWDQGDGVVYDPTNDPNFAAAGGLRFVAPWDPQKVWRFYLGNVGEQEEADTRLAKLTIRGDLSSTDDPAEGEPRWWFGRSSGVAGVASNAMVVQESGVVIHNDGDLDLGSIQTGLPGAFGNGTWDYRGGTLEQGFDTGFLQSAKRLRLSAGGSTAVGGVGTFIMRNPGSGSGGYVRIANFQVAAFGGQNGVEPNGVTNGLGIAEFHATSEGTRPIQVENLLLGNGADSTEGDPGIRSSQLQLILDEAPTVDGQGVPDDMGLFDVDWENVGGLVTNPGNSYGSTFSDPNHVDPLSMDAVFENGDVLEAMFGSTLYRWNIYYDGEIRWSDADNSILDATFGGGDGIDRVEGGHIDIVLIGLESILAGSGSLGVGTVPEPSSVLLAAIAALGMVVRRRRAAV